jgi:hypothetical protein
MLYFIVLFILNNTPNACIGKVISELSLVWAIPRGLPRGDSFTETKQMVTVRVYNMIGQLALEVNYDLQKGDNVVILPHANMDSGQYTVSVTHDERIIEDMRLHILE